MPNQLGKFCPYLATLTKPLRELLSKRNSCFWSSILNEAFEEVKTELTKCTVFEM